MIFRATLSIGALFFFALGAASPAWATCSKDGVIVAIELSDASSLGQHRIHLRETSRARNHYTFQTADSDSVTVATTLMSNGVKVRLLGNIASCPDPAAAGGQSLGQLVNIVVP